jgi:hypothetical protein
MVERNQAGKHHGVLLTLTVEQAALHNLNLLLPVVQANLTERTLKQTQTEAT